MVGWLVNRSRPVIKRYLNEDTLKVINHGYFAVYKRAGITCAEELENIKDAIVKGISGEVVKDESYLLRAGYGGILDSMASGVLAVGLCDGCKVLPLMLQSNKRYTVTGQLGVATDSYSSTGNVVAEKPFDHVTRSDLENALLEFVGEIWQKPPVYSALKIYGKRASDRARAGQEVNLVPRPVKCYAAKCLEFEPPHFTLDVSCSHGFFVRSLIHDLTRAVGSCGHVTALERTKHGPFTLKDCLYPENFSLEAILTAVNKARQNHPELTKFIEDYWINRTEQNERGYRVSRPNDRKLMVKRQKR